MHLVRSHFGFESSHWSDPYLSVTQLLRLCSDYSRWSLPGHCGALDSGMQCNIRLIQGISQTKPIHYVQSTDAFKVKDAIDRGDADRLCWWLEDQQQWQKIPSHLGEVFLCDPIICVKPITQVVIW